MKNKALVVGLLKSILLGVFTAMIGAGCVSTTYSKSITVTKDSTGKIIQTTETETVVQPHGQGWPVKFEHLHGVQPNN
jgi:hypothetical protein